MSRDLRLDPRPTNGDGRHAASRRGAASRGPASTPPRLAFVGLGWIGRARLRAAVERGAAEATLLVDPAAEAVDAARRIAPGARAVGGLEDVLDARPDGVVIATPSALHAEQAAAVLAAGIPVFCQKPLARTAPETAAVVRAAERADLALGVDFAYRHAAAAERMRWLVAAGAIGTVYAADLTFHNAWGPEAAWFRDPALSGGGCLIDLGVHLVDLALWLLGAPAVERVGAAAWAGGRPLSALGPPPSRRGSAGEPFADGDARRHGVAEDHATVDLVLEAGVRARIACSWNLHAGRNALIGVDLHGTKGGLSLRNVGGSFFDFRLDLSRGTRRRRLCSPPDAWPPRALLGWVRAVARHEGFDPSTRQFVRVAEALDAAYLAAARAR